MFSNRRKKQQLKKNTYYNARANNLIKANGPVEQLIVYERVDPPVGSIVAYTVGVSPTGWLVCDGSSVNKEAYSKLYEVIGNTFGGIVTDLSFNLPDYRGAFLRGIGTHNGYEGPSNIHTFQAHATQTHNHLASSTVGDLGHNHTQNDHTHTATTALNDPGHAHTQTTVNDDYNNFGGTGGIPPGFTIDGDNTTSTKNWNNINTAYTGITATTSVVATAATNNTNTTGITVTTTIGNSTTNANPNETRPYNYGVYWIIKY
jgi:microcystin-dependent protein